MCCLLSCDHEILELSFNFNNPFMGSQWGPYDLTYGEGDNNDEDIQLEFLLGVPRSQTPPPRGAGRGGETETTATSSRRAADDRCDRRSDVSVEQFGAAARDQGQPCLFREKGYDEALAVSGWAVEKYPRRQCHRRVVVD